MIITEIIGNIHDDAGAGLVGDKHQERLYLPGADLVKRIQRLRTDHDRELGLRLPSGSEDLKDGDILLVEDNNVVTVSVLSTDVLVIAPKTIYKMAFVAHSLGNRHLPAQFFDEKSEFGAEVMVVQYDHTVEDFLVHYQVPFTREERVMEVPFRHAEHTH